MAILKIARMGHPVLRAVAEPIEDPTSNELARLIADMTETLRDAEGVGLAAPQVHASVRVVLFYVPPGRADAAQDPMNSPTGPVALTVLINPEIEPLDEEMADGWEACLSVPGMMGRVPRYRRIRYRGFAPTGDRIERDAYGFHARVVQHECDHLDGVLYPARIRDLRTLGFVEELRPRAPAEPPEV